MDDDKDIDLVYDTKTSNFLYSKLEISEFCCSFLGISGLAICIIKQ